MNNITYIILSLVILYCLIHTINKFLIFHPSKEININEAHITETYKNNNIDVTVKHDFILTHDKVSISCLKLTKSNSNIIFIFSHGNAGNLANFLYSNTINNLLEYGSVILYDYRGFGLSEGKPSQDGCFYDLKAIWKNTIKQYPSHKIILYGFSLGCYPTLKLTHSLHKNNKILPHYIILQSGFANIKAMAKKFMGQYATYLVIDNFDNLSLMKQLNKLNNIILLHSEKDEIVSYDNAKMLKKAGKCDILDILGTHNNPRYPNSFFDFLDKVL